MKGQTVKTSAKVAAAMVVAGTMVGAVAPAVCAQEPTAEVNNEAFAVVESEEDDLWCAPEDVDYTDYEEADDSVLDDLVIMDLDSAVEEVPKIKQSSTQYFFGYHGTRVNEKRLVPGKFYCMQIAHRGKSVPYFTLKVVKVKRVYTETQYLVFDKVMVEYELYDMDGHLINANARCQANENLLNLTPNHFFEITPDLLQ